eukprot:6947517-Pyramimonas_sp.AAC.2
MEVRLELRLVCRRWASIQRCLTFALHTAAPAREEEDDDNQAREPRAQVKSTNVTKWQRPRVPDPGCPARCIFSRWTNQT